MMVYMSDLDVYRVIPTYVDQHRSHWPKEVDLDSGLLFPCVQVPIKWLDPSADEAWFASTLENALLSSCQHFFEQSEHSPAHFLPFSAKWCMFPCSSAALV